MKKECEHKNIGLKEGIPYQSSYEICLDCGELPNHTTKKRYKWHKREGGEVYYVELLN